jgi:chromosome segregation ATPase
MTMSEERTIALGSYQQAKKNFQDLAIRAGSHLKSLREATDTLIKRKDFLKINFNECATLIDELKQIQSAAKKEIRIIEELESTYNFD